MKEKEILEKLNNLKTKYIYQRYNGIITKYEVRDNYLIDIGNANNTIDINRQIPLGKISENIIDLIEYGDILEIYVDNNTDRVVVYGDILQAIKQGDLIAEDIKTILTHELYEQNSYKVVT